MANDPSSNNQDPSGTGDQNTQGGYQDYDTGLVDYLQASADEISARGEAQLDAITDLPGNLANSGMGAASSLISGNVSGALQSGMSALSDTTTAAGATSADDSTVDDYNTMAQSNNQSLSSSNTDSMDQVAELGSSLISSL
ncbi:hypothetical protein [Legionella spiritensis]|uniref:hypothetical protein n=1 Tax=Legionella spiritensis TaxID=452 RepID=UPI000F70950B|nr:hypothetical protein [Legionella spiritensis]VEG91464.1 Uncharacterised protein [Legionella spiritensis]